MALLKALSEAANITLTAGQDRESEAGPELAATHGAAARLIASRGCRKLVLADPARPTSNEGLLPKAPSGENTRPPNGSRIATPTVSGRDSHENTPDSKERGCREGGRRSGAPRIVVPTSPPSVHVTTPPDEQRTLPSQQFGPDSSTPSSSSRMGAASSSNHMCGASRAVELKKGLSLPFDGTRKPSRLQRRWTASEKAGFGMTLLETALRDFSTEERRCYDDEQNGQDGSTLSSDAFINRKALQGGRRCGDIRSSYIWGERDQLGAGSFGEVFRARSVHDAKRVVAVKQIRRGSIEDFDKLMSEIGILSELDHPHVLRFLESYESAKHVYIVTELCLGGNLQRWIYKNLGDPRFAARVTREITGALVHCHFHGICHRDLKPENVLLVRDSPESPVRVADFGLAKRCSKRVLSKRQQWAEAGGRLRERTDEQSAEFVRLRTPRGTAEYMAPEVVRVLHEHLKEDGGNTYFYDFRCDVWSLGVVAYALIAGMEPYSLEAVSAFVADGTPLPDLSEDTIEEPLARNFIGNCLLLDFTARPTAHALLKHPWLAPESAPPPVKTEWPETLTESPGQLARNFDGDRLAALRKSIASEFDAASATDLADRLTRFAGLTPFKRAALTAAARHLGPYEHEELRALFQKIDPLSCGKLGVEALRDALQNVPGIFVPADYGRGHCDRPGIRTSPKSCWAGELLCCLDTDHSGSVEYTEFLAAVMDHRLENHTDLALAAFRTFDHENKGFVTKADLDHVLGANAAPEAGAEKGTVTDIGFDEFRELLRLG